MRPTKAFWWIAGIIGLVAWVCGVNAIQGISVSRPETFASTGPTAVQGQVPRNGQPEPSFSWPVPSARPSPTVTRSIKPKPRRTVTPRPRPRPTTQEPRPTYYRNCDALREDYPAGVSSNHPAYRSALDRDDDNWACER